MFGQTVPFLKLNLAVVCLRSGEPCGQVVNIHAIRCVSVKRSVQPGLVIERQLACQSLLRGADRLVGMQIHLLVFDALPEPLNNHIIAPTAFPFMLIWVPWSFGNPVNSDVVP